MTLNNLLIQLDDNSSEIYEWLENHHTNRDDDIYMYCFT